MKKIILIVLGLIAAAIIFVVGARVVTGEDDWICQNGQWVKHGNPSASVPEDLCS